MSWNKNFDYNSPKNSSIPTSFHSQRQSGNYVHSARQISQNNLNSDSTNLQLIQEKRNLEKERANREIIKTREYLNSKFEDFSYSSSPINILVSRAIDQLIKQNVELNTKYQNLQKENNELIQTNQNLTNNNHEQEISATKEYLKTRFVSIDSNLPIDVLVTQKVNSLLKEYRKIQKEYQKSLGILSK